MWQHALGSVVITAPVALLANPWLPSVCAAIVGFGFAREMMQADTWRLNMHKFVEGLTWGACWGWMFL
tara:strand:+ start:597 stop:800 length:204 start_codon:yes stop_codon:yes gene_type:complete